MAFSLAVASVTVTGNFNYVLHVPAQSSSDHDCKRESSLFVDVGVWVF